MCEYPPFSTLTALDPTLVSLLVSLDLSFNGQDFSPTQLFYEYLDLMETALNLFKISPYTGPVDGNTIVTVSYPTSSPPITPICRFGATAVIGTQGSDVSFQCNSPPYSGTTVVSVSISFNGVDFSGAVFLFTYEDTARFDSLVPQQGTRAGGTKVLILGKGFKHYPGLGCFFGLLPGTAVYVDQYHLQCLSPPGLQGQVTLTVTFNGQNSYVVGTYQYRSPETIASISPNTGPRNGGTKVTVTVPSYYGGAVGVCRFGNYLSEVLVEGASLFCRSPPYDSVVQSPVSLQISSNGVDFEPGLAFTYYGNLKIVGVVPQIINDSILDRELTIAVGSTTAIIAARVSQGVTEVVLPATQVNSTAVKVTLGKNYSLAVGDASISLTGNYLDFSYEYPLSVIPTAQLSQLVPAFGFLSGGIVVQARGTNFADYPIVCLFGKTEAKARYLTPTLIECVNPVSSDTGFVPVSLSLNGKVDMTNVLQFEYWTPPKVTSLSPSQGRNREEVVITIGTSDARTIVQARLLQATVRDSTWTGPTYSFKAPHHPAATSPILLSWNWLESLSAGSFTYSGECVSGSYCSIDGPSPILPCTPGWYCPYSDNTVPYECIPGEFQGSQGKLACDVCPVGAFCQHFRMKKSEECPLGYLCPVPSLKFVSTLVTCEAGYACSQNTKKPCASGLWCGPASANPSVSVSLDYRTPQACNPGSECLSGFSPTPLGSNACPLGFYCTDGVKIVCPAGNYCPVTGLFQPISCRPGYYSPTKGEVSCLPCDLGYIAPGSGNTSQQICPAGFVCATMARPSPSAVCPAGSYCLEGRKTLSLNVAWGPVSCAPSTYCLLGVSFKTVLDGNVAHPQTCIMGTYCPLGTKSPAAVACPIGFYCPSGSSEPLVVNPGYFTSNEGNGVEQACAPGTYSDKSGASACDVCPAGFFCEEEATTTPKLCPAGSYRVADPTIIYCQLCPEGTWSSKPGLKTLLECTSCTPSIVCAGQGLTNITAADPCPEGYVCGPMTTAFTVLTTPCPGGYWCGISTANAVDYGICEPGYYCPQGTANSTRYQHPCNPGYYCPPATNATVNLNGDFEFIHQASYSDILQLKETANNASCSYVYRANYTNDDDYTSAIKACTKYTIPTFTQCSEDESLPSYLVVQYTSLRCPEGTTSPQGSQCVGQCVSIGDTITVGHYNPVAKRGRVLNDQELMVLNPLSLVVLRFDFKTLNENFKYGKQYSIFMKADYTDHVMMPAYFSSGLVDSDKQFVVVAINFDMSTQNVDVSIALHNALFLPFASQFANTMQVEELRPSRALIGTNNLFIIILWSKTFDTVSMPFNLIDLKKNNGDSRDPLLMDSGSTASWMGTANSLTPFDSSFWQIYGASTLAITWLPFFMNCEEFGDYVHLFALLESTSKCTLYDSGNVTVVESIPSSGFFTKADSCRAELKCYYSEDVQADGTFWFNIQTEQTLFRITQDPHPIEHAFPASSDTFDSIFTSEVVGLSDNIIPVKFYPQPGLAGVPTNITLTIRYYQVDKSLKNLVSVSVLLDGYIETNSSRPGYDLTVIYEALDWFDLLNTFQFAIPTYILLFFVIAIMLLIVLCVVYWLHRFIFRVKDAPKMHFRLYWKTTAIPPSVGTAIGSVPTMLSAVLIQFIRDNNPLKTMSGNWSEPIIPDEETSAVYQRGRVALCLLYAGTFFIFYGASLLFPLPPEPESEDGSEGSIGESVVADEKPLEAKRTRSMDSDKTDYSSQPTQREESSPEDYYNSQVFKRRFFLSICLFISLFTTFKLELSYTVLMGLNLYSFLLMFFVLDIIIYQIFARFVLEEALLVAPFFAALTLNEVMVTMAADNFVSFILAYVFVLGMILFMRMYFNPVMQRVEDKSMMLAIKLIAKYRWAEFLLKRIVMRQLKMHNSLASALSRDSGTNMEGLLDTMTYYSSQVQALLMAPFVFVLIYMFGDETQMPQMYNIRKSDVVFYILFSAVVLLPQLIVDIYAFHLLETLYDYKFFDYFTYCSYRFKVRTTRWLQSAETRFDRSLLLPWRSLDHMCYSSQYYFAVTLSSWGIVMFSLAWTIMLRNSYNLFNDPVGILLIVVTIVLGVVLTYVLKQISLLVRLWRPHAPPVFSQDPPEETDKDQVVNLIEDYMEENALRVKIKTNLFKGKFLKKNKAWIFDNLETICRDNEEVMLMLRKKYSELLEIEFADMKTLKASEEREMQLKAMPYNRPDRLRDDFSEDQGDMQEMCALLDEQCGPIVRKWLDNARLIMGLRDLVRHPENMQPSCEICSSSEDLLFVPEVDFYVLYNEFRASLRGTPIIPWRWKQFYESRQTMHTFCLECSYLHTLKKRNDQALTQPLTRMAAEALKPRTVNTTYANPVVKKIVLRWLLDAKARLLHARPKGDVTTIPDVTGSAVTFSSRSLSFAISEVASRFSH